METKNDPTVVDDIELPIEIVELKHIRTKSGGPVQVRCEVVDELRMLEIIGALPGLSPPDPTRTEAEKQRANMDALIAASPHLIESGTVLMRADGSEQRPAFWFGEPKPGALPGRLLRMDDRVMLCDAIMRVSGYLGGPAEKLRFHGDDGGGGSTGEGSADAGA